jgi:hypothetical protein
VKFNPLLILSTNVKNYIGYCSFIFFPVNIVARFQIFFVKNEPAIFFYLHLLMKNYSLFVKQILSAALLVLALPFAVFCFLKISIPENQLILFIVISCLAISWLFFSKHKKCLDYVIIFSFFILAAAIIWNFFFYLYIHRTGYESDIFRKPVQTLHAPLYGLSQDIGSHFYLITILFVLIFISAIHFDFFGSNFRATQAKLIFVQLLLIAAFCITDGIPRFEKQTVHFLTYSEGLKFFKSIPDLIEWYVPTMGKMGVHNDHYPPGNLLILFIENILQFRWLTLLVLSCASLATTLMIGKICRLLEFESQKISFAQILFVCSANVLIYSTIDFSPIPMFLFTTAIFYLIRFQKRNDIQNAFMLSVIIAIYLFFSFTVCILILFIFIFSLLMLKSNLISIQKLLLLTVIISIANIIFYLLLYHMSGFNLIECFQNAIYMNHKIMNAGSFDNFYRYLIRSSGNLLAYSIGSGVIVFILAFRLRRNSNDNKSIIQLFQFAFILTIIFMSFSGLFFLETERIWLCFVPPMAIAASISYDDFCKTERSILIISAIFTATVLELFWSQN